MNITRATTALAEVKAIDAEIARLQAERAARVEILAKEAGERPGKVTLDNGSFTVRENNTYDEKVMRENLLPGQVRRCTVPKLDKATVKRLYPEVYAMAKVNRGVSVAIG